MRRLVFVLILLIAIGAAVFFVGWIQIQIPAGSFGVIFTKTSGWEPDVIRAGEFVWRWQRLIPTNLSLYVFEVVPHATTVSLSGYLPSGRIYEEVAGDGAAFSYQIQVRVSVAINPERLPYLAETLSLRPDQIAEFYATQDSQISQTAASTILGLIDDRPEFYARPTAFSTMADQIHRALTAAVPYLEIIAIAPTRIDIPDAELYLTARRLALGVMESRAQALSDAARSIALDQVKSETDLDMLRQYAQILDEHPVLLDYFRLGQQTGADPLDLNSILPPASQ